VATIHANNALSALTRLEQLTAEVSQNPMPEIIGEAVDLVISIERTSKGRRVQDLLFVEGYRNGQYRIESYNNEGDQRHVA
jgi:type IV secretion system protein VirB11